MSLDAYEGFLLIVEQGSVTAAARVLGVPRPTVSRRLARLEERLGVRLVERGPQKLVITRTGRELYKRVRAAIDEVGAAEKELRERASTPRGLLRVAVMPLLAVRMTKFLLAFRREHPDVELHVITDTRFVQLTSEGFDVAIRGGILKEPDLVQRRLLTMSAGLYAAPAWLEAHGHPRSVAALARHDLLLDHDTQDAVRKAWPLRRGGAVVVRSAFATNDRQLLRQAAVAGHGIALLTDLEVSSDLDTGALVAVLPAEVGVDIGLHVVYAERAFLPARTRAFVDAVIRLFAHGLP